MLTFLLSGTAYSGPPQNNITAQSWLVADSTGKILDGANTGEVRAIASISKLVTVMVVLDAKQGLDNYIKPYTRRELIQLALVTSDNSAAKTLCNTYPGGHRACIYAMNNKMASLGLYNTKFI